MSDTIRTENAHGVFTISLNRPDSLNAFDEEMGLSFVDALQAAEDPTVRCVVVTGSGRAFSAGEDLRALGGEYSRGKPPHLGEILRTRYNPAIERIISMRKPVVAAINGVAAGAGVSLALACDYRVMASETTLILAFTKVGLIPDAGGTWLLPRYLGVGRALELAFKGDPITSENALELGLVNEVVSTTEVAKAASEAARKFADGPTLAFGLIKHLVWGSGEVSLGKHLEAEAAAQAEAGKSSDHLEGVTAFTTKRAPEFKGR